MDFLDYSTKDLSESNKDNFFFFQKVMMLGDDIDLIQSEQIEGEERETKESSQENDEQNQFLLPQQEYQNQLLSLSYYQNQTYDQCDDIPSKTCYSSSSNNQNNIVSTQSNSKKDRLILKKASYETTFMQLQNPQHLINSNRKFYLFIDQMIDIDYFRNLQKPNLFAEENQAIQLSKGFRLTNQVIHRIDNKFMEINTELIDPQPESIDYIVHILKSLGDKNLIKYVNCLLDFQQNIKLCKQLIYEQSLDINFQSHQQERKVAADRYFQKVTSKLDPSKLIFYQRFTVDYEKLQYQTTLAGYSPALYELLDNGSYSFKDYLLKNGFYDPMSQLFRLGDCFYRTCYFMSSLPKEFDDNLNKQAELDLITCDNFRFPVTMKLDHYYLEKEFDKENGLDLKFYDLLSSYEFTFKDQNIFSQLKQIRKESILDQSKIETIQGEDIDWNQFDYVQTEFFKSYYSEQVKNLVSKGNKWYKRCGFVEFPVKKVKKS